jgi:isopenicillin-N epimerase
VARSEGFAALWPLERGIAFLNHGSYGACPREVLDVQAALRAELEAEPVRFLGRELDGRLDEARAALAAFVGAEADDLAFVSNATSGVNAVLRSLAFKEGDELLTTDHVYGACRNTLDFVARRTGARVEIVPIPFPVSSPDVIVESVMARVTLRTRLALLDHVTSPTGLILPVERLIAELGQRGVETLIDGAHAPGMLSLDVPSIGADWYTGNCHKWLMAPKGSAFLWVAPNRQADTQPLVISHGYGQGFTTEFAWVGTRDPSAWLSVPAAIDFHERLGGARLRERNAALAREQATLLARAWQTERGAPDALTGSMAAVRLPLREPATAERALELRRKLFDDHRIEVPVTAFAEALWARISAHAYNRPADYARLAACFRP